MNGKAEKGRQEDTLKRIIALLLALAGLADRAATRSYPVRCLVLWFLWHGESVARDFVAGSISSAAVRPSTVAAVRHGHEPADAITLAASLRALALLVRNMAALLWRQSFERPGHAWNRVSNGRLPSHGFIQQLLKAAFPLAERCDTS
jgi:hypothetical protein